MRAPVKFGNYYLFERINVGGMAEVFKGASYGVEGFERLFAVKRVLPNISEDQEFIEMFIDEAKIAVQLNHANIGQIFELGNAENSYFIAMEFVQGKDLRAIFDRSRRIGAQLPLAMVCHVIKDVCEALEYAHNKKNERQEAMGLVHRDVSPQNIIVSYDGEVKLIDFGIAKAAGKASRTQAGILKGKFGYMSPEQVRGKSIDQRSDLFALGVVLFELLTLERCFLGESDFSTLEKVRNVDIRRPSTINRDIPPELENIVLRALARNPDDRFQNAAEFQDALQKYLYQSGAFYARKDLAAFMRDTFDRDIKDEATKLSEFRSYARANIPEARRGSEPHLIAPPVPDNSLNGHSPSPPPSLQWDDDELETSVWEGSKVTKAPTRDGPATVKNEPGSASSPFGSTLSDTEQAPQVFDDSIHDQPTGGQRAVPHTPPVLPSDHRPTVDRSQGRGTEQSPPPAASGLGPVPMTPLEQSPQDAPTLNTEPSQAGDVGMGLPPTLYQSREPSLSRRIMLLSLLAVLAAGIGFGAWWLFKEKPPSTATMNVTSDPPAVTIYLDGRSIHDGPTPVRLSQIPPGERRLVISAPGFETATKTINIDAGRLVELGIKLNPKGSTQKLGIALRSEPAGARVWIDDQVQGARTPARYEDLTLGDHKVRVLKEGYLPWEGQVTLENEGILDVPPVKLFPAQVAITVMTEPDGAALKLLSTTGEVLAEGTAPFEFNQVENGAGLTLQIEKEGFEALSHPLPKYPSPHNTERLSLTEAVPAPTPTPNRTRRTRRTRRTERPQPTKNVNGCQGEDCPTGEVKPPRSPETPSKDPKPAADRGPGFLSVMVTPSAKVIVDGKFLQWTPLIKHELSSGAHKVKLVRDRPPNYTREYTVRIKEGQNYKIKDSVQ
ncbi:MAG: protein kinase domain-containing protein [Bradymonadia bacterium]